LISAFVERLAIRYRDALEEGIKDRHETDPIDGMLKHFFSERYQIPQLEINWAEISAYSTRDEETRLTLRNLYRQFETVWYDALSVKYPYSSGDDRRSAAFQIMTLIDRVGMFCWLDVDPQALAYARSGCEDVVKRLRTKR